jgi:uncharacterized membrane protein YkvA (DUF1232 family)
VPLKLTIELSERDLTHFRAIMRSVRVRAKDRDEKVLVAAARRLLATTRTTEQSPFVRERLASLERVIAMLEDEEWALAGKHRERVRTALAYFAEPADLIPDHLPGLGLVDDAIMVELVLRELRTELEAFEDFCRYRESESKRRGAESPATREQWIATKRRQLNLRMLRRLQRVRRERFSTPTRLF